MPRQPVRLPKQWSRHVKSGILHAVALAGVALSYARGRAAGERRLRAQLDQAKSEIALLREELSIKADLDADLEGDVCDLDDGQLLFRFTDPNYIEWQQEAGFTSWNVYEGDLDVLMGTGAYTQLPGSNPLAERHCGETAPWVEDFDNPPTGKTVFSLVTGVANVVEGSLGQDSRGEERPNGNPCP